MRGHFERELRAVVVDMAVDRQEVEVAVVLGVEQRGAKPKKGPGGREQADRRRAVEELTAPKILIRGGAFAKEVGDDQVGPGVAIEVAQGDPHAGLVAPLALAASPASSARSSNRPSPRLWKKKLAVASLAT